MKRPPETMMRARERFDQLGAQGRIPPALERSISSVGAAVRGHVEGCPGCTAVLAAADLFGAVPERSELCPELGDLFQLLGFLAAQVVDPGTAELGPYARRVES